MADNSRFYYLAYAVATAIYVGYALMLVVRWKRVKSRPAGEPSE